MEQKNLEKKELSILVIGMGNAKTLYLILPGQLSKHLIIFHFLFWVAVGITQEWSIKIMSHSAGEELLGQITLNSLMHNG